MQKVSWALKFRPHTWPDLIGQEITTRILCNIIDEKKIHSGYLFTGLHGCGKTSVMRIFAKALNCSHLKGQDPCNTCDSCQSVDSSQDTDYVELDGASSGTIESIRKIKESAQYATTFGAHKIFAIDECLAYDTRVTLPGNQRLKLGTIVNNKLTPTVLAYDFNKRQVVEAKVTSWQKIRRNLNRRTFRLAFASKQGVLDCTEDHKVFTSESGEFKYARNVRPGDLILTVSQRDPSKIEQKRVFSVSEYVSRVDPYHVYDITVDHQHNFIANSKVVANCHAISHQAFQALLKILEEAPEHVVFMLATTEYHRVPETIQSRCLTFALNRLESSHIAGRIALICKNENVVIDQPSIELIAKSAAGSMRDAIVLTEQLYLYTHNNITADTVRKMLGIVDDSYYFTMAEALVKGDAEIVLHVVRELRDQGVQPANIVKALIEVLNELVRVKYKAIREDEIRHKAFREVPVEEIIRIFNSLVSAQSRMATTWQTEEAVLELSLVSICKKWDHLSSPSTKMTAIHKVEENKTATASDLKNIFG